MKEARIILPINAPLSALQKFEDVVYENFGGYTRLEGHGSWRSPGGVRLNENVFILDIAYTQSTANDFILFTASKTFLQEADQVEVYIRYGNGWVQMVTSGSVLDNGRPNEAYHPDFAGIIDAVDQLIDPEQTPGTRVAAFEFVHHALDLGNKGNHRLNARELVPSRLGGKPEHVA